MNIPNLYDTIRFYLADLYTFSVAYIIIYTVQLDPSLDEYIVTWNDTRFVGQGVLGGARVNTISEEDLVKFMGYKEDDTKVEVKDYKVLCTHPHKYLNVISENLKFWYCPDCREEVK